MSPLCYGRWQALLEKKAQEKLERQAALERKAQERIERQVCIYLRACFQYKLRVVLVAEGGSGSRPVFKNGIFAIVVLLVPLGYWVASCSKVTRSLLQRFFTRLLVDMAKERARGQGLASRFLCRIIAFSVLWHNTAHRRDI